MRALRAVLCAGVGVSVPALLAAQGRVATPSRACQVYVDSVRGQTHILPAAAGTQNWYSGGGVFARCLNEPTTINSDSLAYVQALGRIEFINRVHYRDSTATLDSDRLTYWTGEERLHAEGNVFTRNLASGSELRGPNMDYWRAAPGIRDTLEVLATGRPTIRLHPAGDSAAADTSNPFVIVADRVKLRHNDRFWGSGRVTIDRSDMHTRSDSAHLDLADSLAWLIGAARVVGRDTTQASTDTAAAYTLLGQRIRFDLNARHDVRRVRSYRDADARGPDWHLVADTIDMRVDSGKIQRAQAWGREQRPIATSGLSTIVADSLDIHMPEQVMRLVWAFRAARAVSRADSTGAEADWISGDSLRATFVRADSAGTRRSDVNHVDSYGNARAFYHTDNAQDPKTRGVNYSRGQRIAIALRERKVRVVDIVGQVDGVYLEPRAPIADTTRADSQRTDSTRVRSPTETTGAPSRPGRPR
jgi:hypothetical protein